MYLNDKQNTDIDENLKYKKEININFKKIFPYLIFLMIFLFGILLIIIGSHL